jgi:hypothetical protein
MNGSEALRAVRRARPFEVNNNSPRGAKIAIQPKRLRPTMRPAWISKNRLARAAELNNPKATIPDNASPEAM